jgi:hypothetical protein
MGRRHRHGRLAPRRLASKTGQQPGRTARRAGRRRRRGHVLPAAGPGRRGAGGSRKTGSTAARRRQARKSGSCSPVGRPAGSCTPRTGRGRTPFLVPVRPSRSRSTSSSVLRLSTARRSSRPFTVSVTSVCGGATSLGGAAGGPGRGRAACSPPGPADLPCPILLPCRNSQATTSGSALRRLPRAVG